MCINISLKIFLFIILFIFSKQIEIYSLLMIFAFLHEMGHLIAGILLGFKPKNINIMPLGIYIKFDIPITTYNKKLFKSNILSLKKIIIAFAGPMVNILFIILFIMFNISSNLISFQNIIYANLLIFIFNLIPIYPLDGGRILKNILKIIFGNEKALKMTNKISNITMIIISIISSIAILYYKNIALFFITIYLWGITIIQNKRYNLKSRIYKQIEEYDNLNSQNFSENIAKIHN